MPKFGDITNVWSTIREINVSEIRESAEQPIDVALIGTPEMRRAARDALLLNVGRYPAPSRAAFREFDLPLPRERQSEVGQGDLAILVLDGSAPFESDVAATVDKLSMLSQPRVALVIGGNSAAISGDNVWYGSGLRLVFAADAQPQTVNRQLAPVIVDQLADDLKIAAARRLPGLRDQVGRWLVGDVSFSNATYALTSGLPEMIPILTLPLNAADMLVLSKNQALLVYKLALAWGAPSDFQAQMREILPVIGSGFLWRQVARQLVGLIPGFGILPKVAVAYAGTYATGQAAALWYRNGETLSREGLQRLYRQAMDVGRQRGRELIQRRNKGQLPPPQDGSAIQTTDASAEPSKKPRWRWLWPFRRRSR